MKKENHYQYDNAKVTVVISDDWSQSRVKKATEDFMRKVFEFKEKKDAKPKTRTIIQKSV